MSHDSVTDLLAYHDKVDHILSLNEGRRLEERWKEGMGDGQKKGRLEGTSEG